MRASRFALGTLVIGLCALAGCNRGPQMAEVEGTVTLKGKPLERVQVEFYPEREGPRSIAVTDQQGHYVLMADGDRVGAAVGPHKVVLRDLSIFPEKLLGRKAENVYDIAQGKKQRISTNYNDALKTPLRKEVTAGQKNQIDLEVSP